MFIWPHQCSSSESLSDPQLSLSTPSSCSCPGLPFPLFKSIFKFSTDSETEILLSSHNYSITSFRLPSTFPFFAFFAPVLISTVALLFTGDGCVSFNEGGKSCPNEQFSLEKNFHHHSKVNNEDGVGKAVCPSPYLIFVTCITYIYI